MSFLKIGTPQKITVLSSKCAICGIKKGEHIINGSLVCSECAGKKEDTIEENNENEGSI